MDSGALPSLEDWVTGGAAVPAIPCRLRSQAGAFCTACFDGLAEHVMVCPKSQHWNGHHPVKRFWGQMLNKELQIHTVLEQPVPELYGRTRSGTEAKPDLL